MCTPYRGWVPNGLHAYRIDHLQGVYGLVSNLGSLVVRTLFQPLEEAAFAAFSAWGAEAKASTPAEPASEKSGRSSTKASGSSSSSSRGEAGMKLQPLLRALSPMVKAVALLGLLAAAFGPSYSYVLLRLVYGTRWSETEAPAVLAAYSVYVLLLALNGGCVVQVLIHRPAVPRTRPFHHALGQQHDIWGPFSFQLAVAGRRMARYVLV